MQIKKGDALDSSSASPFISYFCFHIPFNMKLNSIIFYELFTKTFCQVIHLSFDIVRQ